MLNTLKKYESIMHAGLLARAALLLKDNISPDHRKIIDGEDELIRKVIDEITNKYNLDKSKTEDIDKIVNHIDDEIDTILPDGDNKEILLKLAEKSELPSDLYEIFVVPNIKEFYGKKFNAELEFIQETIKNPDKEQHYGPPSNDQDPFLISLFSKYYKSEFPFNSFILLVIGQRDKLKLNVHQVWRIYSDLIPNSNVMTLIDLLREFAEVFGIEMETNGQKGKFFLTESTSVNSSFNIKVLPKVNKKGKEIKTSFTFSHFIQNNPKSSKKQASLLIAIDLIKYSEILKSRKW